MASTQGWQKICEALHISYVELKQKQKQNKGKQASKQVREK